MLKRIDLEVEQPTKPGKYIVDTITTGPLKLKNSFLARLYISDKGKLSFDVNNQVVTHWYKELN